MSASRDSVSDCEMLEDECQHLGENPEKNSKNYKRLEITTSEDRLKELGFSNLEKWNNQSFLMVALE